MSQIRYAATREPLTMRGSEAAVPEVSGLDFLELGARIFVRARERSKLTQDELADRLTPLQPPGENGPRETAISRATISRWETAATPVPAWALLAAVHFSDATIEELSAGHVSSPLADRVRELEGQMEVIQRVLQIMDLPES